MRPCGYVACEASEASVDLEVASLDPRSSALSGGLRERVHAADVRPAAAAAAARRRQQAGVRVGVGVEITRAEDATRNDNAWHAPEQERYLMQGRVGVGIGVSVVSGLTLGFQGQRERECKLSVTSDDDE